MRNIILIILLAFGLGIGGLFLHSRSDAADHAKDPSIQVQDANDAIKDNVQEKSNDINMIDYPDDSDIFSIEHALSERYIGRRDAPVVFQDFSSLSCPHCATFHNEILPQIKENFIKTGDVRMVFEVMPLNPTALMGEQLARCLPKRDFYQTITLLYANQDIWAFTNNPRSALTNLVKLAGIPKEKVDQCLDNRELELALSEKARENTMKYNIRSTPSLIFDNGERKFTGVGSYDRYADLLEFLIEENKNK